jgi:hypothetical protein
VIARHPGFLLCLFLKNVGFTKCLSAFKFGGMETAAAAGTKGIVGSSRFLCSTAIDTCSACPFNDVSRDPRWSKILVALSRIPASNYQKSAQTNFPRQTDPRKPGVVLLLRRLGLVCTM